MDTVPMKSTGDFHEIRRKDRILDGERAVELLQTAEYGYLSLGESDNGYAYGVPLNFAYDPEGNALYFHCAPEGHKVDNMKRNNKVSFCVVGRTKVIGEKFSTLYESVMVFGKAETDPTGEDKRTALRKLLEKYSPDHPEAGEQYMEQRLDAVHTFKIRIESLTAKGKIR